MSPFLDLNRLEFYMGGILTQAPHSVKVFNCKF